MFRKLLIMLKNLQQMQIIFFFEKSHSKKYQKQLVIWLVIKFLIELQKFQKKSETVANEHDKEIPKERYISPEERQKMIDELRLK